jgi:hypothetical protein
MRLLGLNMLVLKIINKHILQTGMKLYLILSCDVYSIGHHYVTLLDTVTMAAIFQLQKMYFSPFNRHSSYLRPFNLNDLNALGLYQTLIFDA